MNDAAGPCRMNWSFTHVSVGEDAVIPSAKPDIARFNDGAGDALHPVFEGLEASMPVRARRRSPLHALPNLSLELQ